jgi:hypothetical protein
MAKSHDSFKKRKRELERKLKQEQKRQRKLDKKTIKSEDNPNQEEKNINNLFMKL